MSVRLVLASGSPRRADLLRTVGLSFTVDPADVDEAVLAGEDAVTYVERVARDKWAVVAARHPDAVVLAADTTVALGGEILGKPADDAAALAMLTRLSGRTHHVHTAIVANGRSQVVTTGVTFGDLTGDEIAAYVAMGESLDKAGGYGMQSAGAMLVERIDGSPSNVIGLPVRETLALLRLAGLS